MWWLDTVRWLKSVLLIFIFEQCTRCRQSICFPPKHTELKKWANLYPRVWSKWFLFHILPSDCCRVLKLIYLRNLFTSFKLSCKVSIWVKISADMSWLPYSGIYLCCFKTPLIELHNPAVEISYKWRSIRSAAAAPMLTRSRRCISLLYLSRGISDIDPCRQKSGL